jgi:hypothetical protein
LPEPWAEGDLLQDAVVLQPRVTLLGAGTDVGVDAVETTLIHAQVPVLGDLVRAGETTSFTFVAEVGQHRVPGVTELNQGGQQPGVDTGAAGVVFPARAYR